MTAIPVKGHDISQRVVQLDPLLPVRRPVKLAPGLTFDDKDAGRFVDTMLHELDRKARANRVKIQSLKTDSRLGNPKAQMRWYRRAIAATGDTLLTSFMQTGNRGRFFAYFVDWTVKTPEFKAAGDGDLRWLFAIITAVDSQGGENIKEYTYPALAITRHALVRAIQRAGVSEAAGFAGMIKGAWAGLEAVILNSGKTGNGQGAHGLPEFGQGWPIPIHAPNGKRLLMVLKRAQHADGSYFGIVPSIIDSEASNRMPVFDEIEAMIARASRRATEGMQERLDFDRLRALFETAIRLGF